MYNNRNDNNFKDVEALNSKPCPFQKKKKKILNHAMIYIKFKIYHVKQRQTKIIYDYIKLINN